MGIKETRKQHFFSTYDFWEEHAKGIYTGTKNEWYRYNEIKLLEASCAFCHYFEYVGCPLMIDCVNCYGAYRICCDGNFKKWGDCVDKELKILYAKEIFNRIKKYMIEIYRDEFKDGERIKE